MRIVLILLLIASIGLSCAQTPGPREVAEAYIKALDNPDYKLAYDYYSEGMKQARPEANYMAWRRDREEECGKTLSYQFEELSKSDNTVVFRINVQSEKKPNWATEFVMTKENGQWKIAGIRQLKQE